MATTTPNRNDVLFGRGNFVNTHSGNEHYRGLVDARRDEFLRTKKRKEKRAIAAGVVGAIRDLHPPGRFLVESPSGTLDKTMVSGPGPGTPRATDSEGVHPAILGKAWVVVDEGKVMDKVMHRLRERPAAAAGGGSEGQKHRGGASRLSDPPGKAVEASEAKDGEPGKTMHLDIIRSLCGGGLKPVDETADKFVPPLSLGEQGSNRRGSERDASRANGVPGDAKAKVEDKDLLPASFGAAPSTKHEQPDEVLAPENAPSPLDDEVITFLRGFSAWHDGDVHEPRELTLRQWIEKSKPPPKLGSVASKVSPEDMYHYAKLALPVAVRLTEFLIEAEHDHPNSVPLESICIENCLIRSRHLGEGCVDQTDVHASPDGCTGCNNPHIEEYGETDFVMIMSKMGENPDAGDTMSRLHSLGTVLHELFSGEAPPPEKGPNDFGAPLPNITLQSIHLDSEANSTFGPRRKKSSQRNRDGLEPTGMPNALRSLLENLLDCGQGEFSGDEAYTSFADLRLDLQLMVDSPECFLADIPTNPIPKLQIASCKLYGRDFETSKIEESYQLHKDGKCNGVIIAGGAGVGKSRLAMHAQNVATRFDGSLFFSAKFGQEKDTQPLWTIGAMFNEICDLLAQGSSQSQLQSLERALVGALGTQAALITAVVPSLQKLMPPCGKLSPSRCVNSAMSLRFLFCELLDVFVSHFPATLTFFIDDLQFADALSLLLISTLVSNVEEKRPSVFFICCYRDDEADGNDPLSVCLSSISTRSLQSIKLKGLTTDGVNALLSETLHLSPRMTLPLASILRAKSCGNPLFLQRLLCSLEEQSLVYFNLKLSRWSFDLEKISDLKISDDVVVLLVDEMKKLPEEEVFALKMLSCLGSSVKRSILDILSQDLGTDLHIILQQVLVRGYLNKGEGDVFSFVHDKVKEASFEMMEEQKQKENHLKLGLALCAHTMAGKMEKDDEIFFLAVNQINRAGPELVKEPSQRGIIAQLNLKAGRRSLVLSDFSTAFQLFKHGIAFLNPGNWDSQYPLSVELFDAAAEAACMTNRKDDVMIYSDILVANAKTYEDKLNCLCTAAKALRQAELLHESLHSTLNIFDALGEARLRHMGDVKLFNDMNAMNDTLNGMTDDSIYNAPKSTSKRINTLVKLYANLNQVLYFTDPSLMAAVSLRMVELTVANGLTPLATLAFASYGEVLASMCQFDLACRLGRLAIRLLERDGLESGRRSCVICHVYQTIFWVSTPYQSIVAAHKLGHKSGQQAGDFLYATLNLQLAITTSWAVGESLEVVKSDIRGYITKMQAIKNLAFVGNSILLHDSCVILIKGTHVLNDEYMDGIPGRREILSEPKLKKDNNFQLAKKIHLAVRMFHFRQFDIDPSVFDVSSEMLEKKHQLRVLPLMGLFYQALINFQLSRRFNDSDNWMQNAEHILSQFKGWSSHSKWNFESKVALLEAEKMYSLGSFHKAEPFYMRSIESAREHKFVHDEACASELAGIFYCKMGSQQKAIDLLKHSLRCYDEWGALAVSRRVQTFIEVEFGLEWNQLDTDSHLSKYHGSDTGSPKKSKKRQELE